MLESPILDVAIALIFTFLAVSLAAGSVVEAIASVVGLRAKTLKAGIMDLLNDKGFDDLAAELYSHALINPRGPGVSGADATTGVKAVLKNADADAAVLKAKLSTNMPAYIDPVQFAKAFVDILTPAQAGGALPSMAALQQAVNTRVPAAENPQLNQMLNGIILRAGGDIQAVRDELSGWFDGAMDRLSGVYKRYTQVISFLAALAISVIINADALQVAQHVWAQPTLVAGMKLDTTKPPAQQDIWQPALQLPIGWTGKRVWSGPDPNNTGAWVAECALAVLGWLVTALASLFGAPFWFDALQRVTRLKGTGPSPDEKTDKTAASA